MESGKESRGILSGLRPLLLFMGSGLIVSVAYIDPGNWGTNISGGASFNYDLLWVIWLASGMAMLFQYLSGKIGIAGYSLPELVKEELRNPLLVAGYWVLAEIAILATDLAEFLGIVVALNLLFGIPLMVGTLIAVADVFLVLLLAGKKFRRMEQAFIGFVGIVGLAFVYEVFLAKPDPAAIAFHSVVPVLSSESALIAVGIIGATVMPHALFVHSWLIKNKIMEFGHLTRQKLLQYHLVDNVVSLFLAGLINASMLIMAAAAFFQLGGGVATLSDAYHTLIPLFGPMAATLFALALLAAGISSSVTGTLAGQSIMDALTGFKVSLWVRRIITRVINVIPLTIALYLGIEPLKILVYSQVVLSLLIPLPLLPIILFTANPRIMKELVNRKATTLAAIGAGLIILGFNAYLLFSVFTGGLA
ncbi:MAG: Nramp family divalent metal transporter [Candidatus Diapherotrites archaeon]|nr:Nramp family divalent metal transporter [Candidatus Diapherotrites archaeon]